MVTCRFCEYVVVWSGSWQQRWPWPFFAGCNSAYMHNIQTWVTISCRATLFPALESPFSTPSFLTHHLPPQVISNFFDARVPKIRSTIKATQKVACSVSMLCMCARLNERENCVVLLDIFTCYVCHVCLCGLYVWHTSFYVHVIMRMLCLWHAQILPPASSTWFLKSHTPTMIIHTPFATDTTTTSQGIQ